MKNLSKTVLLVFVLLQSSPSYTWRHALPMSAMLSAGIPFAFLNVLSKIKTVWQPWDCPSDTVAQCYLGSDQLGGRIIPMQKCLNTKAPSDLESYADALSYFQNATQSQGDFEARRVNVNSPSDYGFLMGSVFIASVPWLVLATKKIMLPKVGSSMLIQEIN
ncbi:MAG: hypothetical protein WCK49_02100 [Myxococcaceae bacterium]